MEVYKKYIFLSVSLFFKLVINVFIIFFIAKQVGVESFGSFSIAFIISSLATLCLDYGFNLQGLVLTSKTQKEINKTLASMISAKLLISVFILFTYFGIYYFTNYNNETKNIILILGFSVFPASFGNFYLNNFKIINKYDKESVGYIIQGIILLILFFVNYLYGQPNVLVYASIILISKLFYFFYSFFIFRKIFFKKIRFNLYETIYTLKLGGAYGVHLILGASIIYIDTFILSFLSTLENVGLYQAGMRIIMASMLISVIISDSFIPEISKIFKDKEVVSKKLVQLFNFILFFSGITLITIYCYKKTIIMFLFSSEYLVLASFFGLITAIIFLRYIGIVPGIILTSFGKQAIRARAVLISIIISIIINLFLIPKLAIEGAFIASLIAHIVLNSIYVYYAFRTINFIKIEIKLLLILLIYSIFQSLIFEDSPHFLFFTIVLNIILLAIYLFINIKKSNHEI